MVTPLRRRQALAALLLSGHLLTGSAGEALLSTATLKGAVAVKTWKQLRDQRVVKQDLDYSCGAASLATVLNEYYGMAVTEAQLLSFMEQDGAASFRDLAAVARAYGLRAWGVAVSFDQLRRLKLPAIAYLRYRGDDHFSVIRGVTVDGGVSLADPSWGNRHFTARQFLNMWETRPDDRLSGKVLLLLPDTRRVARVDGSFFTPIDRDAVARELFMLRRY